jgi:hypothetical protein
LLIITASDRVKLAHRATIVKEMSAGRPSIPAEKMIVTRDM